MENMKTLDLCNHCNGFNYTLEIWLTTTDILKEMIRTVALNHKQYGSLFSLALFPCPALHILVMISCLKIKNVHICLPCQKTSWVVIINVHITDLTLQYRSATVCIFRNCFVIILTTDVKLLKYDD